jgi:hypothetical protein
METDLEELLLDEIGRAYSGEINALAEMVAKSPANINIYATEKKIAEEVIGRACRKAGMKIVESPPYRESGEGEREVYLLRPGKKTTGSLKRMYGLLERYKKEGFTLIFLITSLEISEGMEKRVRSRMGETKVYIGKMSLESYKEVFRKIFKKHKLSLGTEERKNSVLARIEEGYEVDRSLSGMKRLFYSVAFGLSEPCTYEILNGVHLVLLIASTHKKISERSAAEEFAKSVQSIKHLRGVDANIVLRRYFDLVEMGHIRHGVFVGDRAELEKHIREEREVYLRMVMKRAKSHWAGT